MQLEPYRDMSSLGGTTPGFQFEFRCSSCDKIWRSPFKPYRKGQAAGFFSNLVSNFHIATRAGVATRLASEAGLSSARQSALADARNTADSMFTACTQCDAVVCVDCLSRPQGLCRSCQVATNGPRAAAPAAAGGSASTAAPAMSCPNCRAAHGGGRFCAECGFDMASTHKSCPDCGAMALRQARFCNECGHGF
jgi:Double zinc ribbon